MKKRQRFTILAAVLMISLFTLATTWTNVMAATLWRFRTYTSGADKVENIAARTFADTVAKKAEGKLKIKVFEGGTLGYTGFEMPQVVRDGLVDMAVIFAGILGSKQPAFSACELPFLFSNWKPDYDKIAPRLAVMEALPIYQKMANEMGLQFFNAQNIPDQLQSNKIIATVADFKGIKLRAWSPMIAQFGKALGSTIVTVPFPELYTGFATNIVEANVGDATAMIDFKFHEVVKYFTPWPITAAHSAVIINKKAWDALDKKTQNIVAEGMDEFSRSLYNAHWVKDWEKRKELEAYGVKVIEVSPAEKAKIRPIINKAIWDPWAKESGEYGQKLIDIMMKY